MRNAGVHHSHAAGRFPGCGVGLDPRVIQSPRTCCNVAELPLLEVKGDAVAISLPSLRKACLECVTRLVFRFTTASVEVRRPGVPE